MPRQRRNTSTSTVGFGYDMDSVLRRRRSGGLAQLSVGMDSGATGEVSPCGATIDMPTPLWLCVVTWSAKGGLEQSTLFAISEPAYISFGGSSGLLPCFFSSPVLHIQRQSERHQSRASKGGDGVLRRGEGLGGLWLGGPTQRHRRDTSIIDKHNWCHPIDGKFDYQPRKLFGLYRLRPDFNHFGHGLHSL
jgi:hypothetical protein